MSDLVRVVLSVILPPLGVFFQVGVGMHFWLNIVLTLCGYIPGLVHAIWIIARPKPSIPRYFRGESLEQSSNRTCETQPTRGKSSSVQSTTGRQAATQAAFSDIPEAAAMKTETSFDGGRNSLATCSRHFTIQVESNAKKILKHY